MKCPKCRARSYVSTTTTHSSGGIYRYRRCSGCNYNFVSLEQVLEERPKLGRPPSTPTKPEEKKRKVSMPKHNVPKLKAPLTKQDAALINKMRTEVRRKLEDLHDYDEEDW